MTDSTATDQAKTSEDHIEQHLRYLSCAASCLQDSVNHIGRDIRSCINGPVFVTFSFLPCFSWSSGSSCRPVPAAT